MRRFDGYVRNQKELERKVNAVLSECKTVRRDVFEWTDMMAKKVEECEDTDAPGGGAVPEMSVPALAQSPAVILNGGTGPPGQITMMSVPKSLVPPELLPKKNDALDHDENDEADS